MDHNLDLDVDKFDLVCNDSIYGWLAKSIMYMGMALSTTLFGIISDRYGRLFTLYPSCIMMAVIGFASAFATQYWQFVTSRFIMGCCVSGCTLPIVLLTSEYVGPRYRPLSQTMTWVFYAIGLLILDGIANYVREWRTLMIISSAPWILVLVFWKFIPESMRWHATNNKMKNAVKTLQRIAKINKKTYPKECVSVPPTGPKSRGFLALFSTCSLVTSIFIQGFSGFVNAIVYYGASFGAGDFGGNMYLNFFLTSLVEIPANFVLIYCCGRFGRKKSVIIPMLLGGAACLIVSFIPAGTERTDYIVGRVIGGIFGKGAITVSFGGILVWGSELFPTVLRGRALSILDTLGNLGAFTAPFVIEAKRIHPILPFGIMGGLAVIAALMSLVLPETKNKPTAEVLEIGPQTGEDTSILIKGAGDDHVEEFQNILEMQALETT